MVTNIHQQVTQILQQLTHTSLGPVSGIIAPLYHSSCLCACDINRLHPFVHFIVACYKDSHTEWNDGKKAGLFLISGILRDLTHSPYQLHSTITTHEVILEHVLRFLQNTQNAITIRVDWLDTCTLLALVRGVLMPKLIPRLGYSNLYIIQHLCVTIVQAFLSSIPTALSSQFIPYVRYLSILGPSVDTTSCFKETVVLDIPVPFNFPQSITEGKVLVFTSNLDPKSLTLNAYLTKTTFQIGNSALWSVMFQYLQEWQSMGVRYVMCQRVIHPRIRHKLSRYDIHCIDKVSQRHIEAITRGTGATAIGSLTAQIDSSHLGYIHSLQIRYIASKPYIFLKVSKELIASVVICAPDTHTLHVVQSGMQAAVTALQSLLHSPYVVPGAGCAEVFLIRCLREKIQQSSSAVEIANIGNVIAAVERVVCGMDATVARENLLDYLHQCNSSPSRPSSSSSSTSSSPSHFYGWDPRLHHPLLSFRLPQSPSAPSCPSSPSPTDDGATKKFIVDSLWMKTRNITNVLTAVNTILQTHHVYFVEQ